MPTPAEELKAAKDLYDLKIKSAKLSASEKANFAATAADIKKSGDDINRWNTLLSNISDITDSLRDSLTYIADSFRDSVNELSKQNIYLNAQKSALNKLSDIANKTLNIRRGESELDTKRLAKLRLETTEKIRQLEWSKKQYDAATAEGARALKAIKGQIDDAHKLYEAFDEVLAVDKAFNKEMGLSPGIAAGLDKALQKIGMPALGIADALSETKMLHQEAISTGQSINLWKTFSGKVWDNFTGIFTKANLIQASIVFLIDAFTSVDSAIGDMAKGLDMSYNSAANLRMELTDIANFSGDAAVNTKGLQESLMAVSQTLGINARLSSEDLVTFTKLREQAGYTNEELTSMQRITTITGGSLEANSKTFLGTIGKLNAQNKLAINAKQLFKDIANVSDAIKLSVGGTAEKIATAAFKAKQFGINLQQADQISQSLLDFESSISNELSAELITGKDLNLEKARLLAINGDIAGASAEILKQVGGTAEFTKMNRIQQEALAKSVGMTREDLAKSLVDREASAKLGAKEGQSAQDRYNELVKSYGVEKASAMLGDEALARQFQQQSTQERFAQSIEKLKEIFVSLIEPLMPVFDIFADIMGIVGLIVGVIGTMVKYTIQWGKYLLPIIGAYKTLQFLGDAQYRTSVLTNFSKKTGIASDQVQLLLAKQKEIAEGKSLMTSKIQEYYKNRTVASTIMDNIQKRLGLALDKESLLGKIKGSLITAKDFLLEKASLAFKYTRNVLEVGYNAIKRVGSAIAKSELLTNIGTAAMKAIQSLSSIPVVGWALGLAAAAGTVALGYKFMKGDDVMSEGGYGNRTLLTPKGSIALNDNDTVIAGTNLGGGNKPQPQPQQQQQQQAPPPAAPIIVQVSPNVNVGKERISNAFQQNSYSIS